MDDHAQSKESLLIRIHGSPSRPTIIHLPGTHGDWTLIAALRNRLLPDFCFVELTYPRTTVWTIEDYASKVLNALTAHGVRSGWLLGESFGSQIGWRLAHPGGQEFKCEGIILAGGFARHPFPWGVPLVIRSLTRLVSSDERRARLIKIYTRYVRRFYETTAETEASLEAFAQRRTEEDTQAAIHRLRLIRANDPAPLIRAFRLPVFSISGLWDPMVPWYIVNPWLRRHCPSFQDARVIWAADHNVLFSAPSTSARTIQGWLQGLFEKDIKGPSR